MFSILNKKISWLLPLFVFMFLVVGFGAEATTQINFTGFTVGSSNCSGGGGSACQSLVTSNTAVGLAPISNPDLYKIVGSEGMTNWQNDGTFETRGTQINPSGGAVQTNGYVWNVPGGDPTEYEAQYSCFVGGSPVSVPPIQLSSNSTWNASLPDGASCNLEIAPRSGASVPPPGVVTACDGTPSNPCYIGICQTGQCKVTSTHPDGSLVQPGDRSQCAVSETDCLTQFTISVSPVNATINTGASAVYAVTFNFNNNKPYRFANISVSAPGLSDSNNNFYWSGSGYSSTTKASVGVLDMLNNATGAIDQTRTLFLTVSNPPRGSYDLIFRASTGDAMGINADRTLNFANCFGNCNPTANATLTVNIPSCTNSITTSPSNGVCNNISANGYTLGWTRANGTYSTQYVRVSTSYDGVANGLCAQSGSASYDPVNCRNNVSSAASTFAATGLQPNTTYYNRVAAVCTNPDGTIGYKDTPVWSCTTNNPTSSCVANPTISGYSPNPAVLTAASGNITVNWGTVAGANNYRVELENSTTGVVTTQNNVVAGSATFSVTPAANGTTYKVRVYSNVSAPATSCSGVSEYMITVYPPANSCPATQGTVTLSKYSAAVGDVTVKAISPGGYTCSDFNSSNTTVADVIDPASGSPASSFLTLNNAGNTNISASGCVYQGGPVCPVSSAQLTVTSGAPGGGYDFTLSPTTFNFQAILDPITQTIVNITPAAHSMSLTASNSNPGNLQITMPWRLGEFGGFAPVLAYDQEMDAYYNLGPGVVWNFGNNIIITNDAGYKFPGNYSETLTYAGYTDANNGATKVTANKSIVVNLEIKNATSENISYTVSPANLTFPTSGGTTRNGSLPPSQNITVTNTGNTNLSIGVNESVAWADFTIVGGGPNPFTLVPSATKTITVSMNTSNPSPSTQDSYTGAVNFTENLAGDKSVGITYNFVGGGGSCTPVNGGWSGWS
jgi:hypothetical protein